MALTIGGTQWQVMYNSIEVEGVEEANPKLDVDTKDLVTLAGQKLTLNGARSASVELKIVDMGTDNLKAIVPDSWIAAGTQIAGQPTGTIAKTGGKGVITHGQVKCPEVELLSPLQLIPCNNADAATMTFFDAIATLTGAEIKDGVLTLTVRVDSRAVGVQVAIGDVTFATGS